MSETIHLDREAAGEGQPALVIPSWQTGKLKLAVISLSLANLCFLLTWKQVLGLAESPPVRFFEESAPDVGLLLALILDVCVVALVIFGFGLLRGSRAKTTRRTASAGLAVFCLLAFYQLERLITQSLDEWKPYLPWKIPKIVMACILLFLVVRFRHRVLRSTVAFLLILFPAFPILALNGWWQFATVDLNHAKDQPALPMLPGTRDRPHLIWITFDELDDRILFAARPQRIQLPEFDRLRSHSIYAGHTLSAGDQTLYSMPSFILGRKILDLKLRTSRMFVQFEKQSSFVDFASQPNVFRSARAAGLNAGLAGWYVSYCRFMGSDTSDCTWSSLGTIVGNVERHLRAQPLYKKALYLLDWQARWSVPALVEPWHRVDAFRDAVRIWREEDVRAMKSITANGFRMLRNPSLNLVFIHVPVPHPPGIWDTRDKKFTLENSDYIDNLALADATLGQIRNVMEEQGDWDTSTVLISGDHPYRPGLWDSRRLLKGEMEAVTQWRAYPYVPFFLKLPGQHSEADYTRTFNNVLSADLALEILKGQLKTPQEVVSWLDAHAASSLR